MDQTPTPDETRPHSICTTPTPDETRPHGFIVSAAACKSLNPRILGSSFSTSNILLSLNGGRMTPTDSANNRWSYPKGVHNMSYIRADSVTNFTVRGKLPLSSLDPGRSYKGVFKLELTTKASGWEGDFEVSLTVPGSRQAVQPRIHTYNGRSGSFTLASNTFEFAAPQRNASLEFSLTHTGQKNREGLIVKSFVIQQVDRLQQPVDSSLRALLALKFKASLSGGLYNKVDKLQPPVGS